MCRGNGRGDTDRTPDPRQDYEMGYSSSSSKSLLKGLRSRLIAVSTVTTAVAISTTNRLVPAVSLVSVSLNLSVSLLPVSQVLLFMSLLLRDRQILRLRALEREEKLTDLLLVFLLLLRRRFHLILGPVHLHIEPKRLGVVRAVVDTSLVIRGEASTSKQRSQMTNTRSHVSGGDGEAHSQRLLRECDCL
jgi:hypothetical protein